MVTGVQNFENRLCSFEDFQLMPEPCPLGPESQTHSSLFEQLLLLSRTRKSIPATEWKYAVTSPAGPAPTMMVRNLESTGFIVPCYWNRTRIGRENKYLDISAINLIQLKLLLSATVDKLSVAGFQGSALVRIYQFPWHAYPQKSALTEIGKWYTARFMD